DGQWIYAGTMSAIVRIPAAGGPAPQLAPVRGISLDVSRDGKYVYFVREATDTALWRAETAGGRVEKVLEGLLPYCSSCWVLTDRGVYYLGGREGSSGRQTLFFHDFATGRTKSLLDYPEPLSPIGSGPFSLSPDGRYLLCVRLDPSNADVYRVDGFR
ncbi:MAG: TolB family protein, partial [Bryobacteraceae bacterium]